MTGDICARFILSPSDGTDTDAQNHHLGALTEAQGVKEFVEIEEYSGLLRLVDCVEMRGYLYWSGGTCRMTLT